MAIYIGIIPTFTPDSDFTIFEERFEQFCLVNKIVDEKCKVALLLSQMETDVYKILRDLSFPIPPKDKSLEELKKELQKHFSPKVNVFRERIQFFRAHQTTEETSNEWYARLKNLAVNCKFEHLQETLVDRFVSGMREGPVMDRLVEEPVSQSLEKLIEIANSKELALAYTTGKGSEDRIQAVYSGHRKLGNFRGRNQHKPRKPDANEEYKESYDMGRVKNQSRTTVKCKCCGKTHAGTCKFQNYTCNACGKKGHLQSVCRARQINAVETLQSEQGSGSEQE
ncbi:uncharacterized protein LOC135119709 [Zophobas morio]|uniref:uncharacterized protein LOC135119709 n=1 Tax=Zophobas morio TaxID=2755281 RepID=UPI003082F50A